MPLTAPVLEEELCIRNKPTPVSAEYICNGAFGAVVPMPTLPLPNMAIFVALSQANLIPAPAFELRIKVSAQSATAV